MSFNWCKRSKILKTEMLKFGEIYRKKCKFHFSKKLININDSNIESILGSSKYNIREEWFKFFIGYVNNFDDEIKPLLTKLSKLSGSVKRFWKANCIIYGLRKTIS